MWVVKLGGSLMQSVFLKEWLITIAELGKGRVVIVPGGGVFADHVRNTQSRLHFDDLTAHKMALLAMEQFGLLIHSLEPTLYPARSEPEILNRLDDKQIPVWFPYSMIADNTRIQASWDITSDSLALWLTEQLNFQNLVLIKSIIPENNNFSAEFLSQEGYLDKAFAHSLNKLTVKTVWISHEQVEQFSTLINKETGFSENQIN